MTTGIRGIQIISTEQGSFPAGGLSNTDIGIAVITLKWKDLDHDKVIQTAFLESKLMAAISAEKNIILAITAGNSCPAYCFSVSKPAIEFVEYRQNGKGKKIELALPNPCDPIFQDQWLTFLDKVFSFIVSKPILFNAIVGVYVTGINANNAIELRQPFQTPEITSHADTTNAPEIWLANGYDELEVEMFFSDIATMVYVGFRFADVATMISVLGSQAFPCIDENGIYEYGGKQNFSYKLSNRLKSYSNAAINSTALTATSGTPQIVKSSSLIQGYQISLGKYGKNQATPEEFEAVLQHGLDAGASYIQISDANACNPQYKEAIKKINQLLINE